MDVEGRDGGEEVAGRAGEEGGSLGDVHHPGTEARYAWIEGYVSQIA